MIPLVLDDAVREQLKALRELAEANPVNMPKLMTLIKTPEGKTHHMAQMTRQTIKIPMAYKVTLSIEHGHPVGQCRHMSMSVDAVKRVPSPEAFWMIAKELGFWGGGLLQCHAVWNEELGGHGVAVNAVQTLNPIKANAN